MFRVEDIELRSRVPEPYRANTWKATMATRPLRPSARVEAPAWTGPLGTAEEPGPTGVVVQLCVGTATPDETPGQPVPAQLGAGFTPVGRVAVCRVLVSPGTVTVSVRVDVAAVVVVASGGLTGLTGLPPGTLGVGWGTLPVSVSVTGQTVVYHGMVSVVTWPTGQLVTWGGQAVTVWILVV